MQLARLRMESPVGTLEMIASEHGLRAVLWGDDRPGRVELPIAREDGSHPVLQEAERQLGEYFAGQRTRFALPLDLQGTTFQKRVWELLQQIPFGETCSYGELAAKLGNPGAMRAVGAANGKNPVSIVVPCHRVIGASGRLTGFAGGLEVKARLLAIEQQHRPFALVG